MKEYIIHGTQIKNIIKILKDGYIIITQKKRYKMAKAVIHVNKFPGNNKTNMFLVESFERLSKSGLMLALMFLLGMIVCGIVLGIVYYFLLRCKECPEQRTNNVI